MTEIDPAPYTLEESQEIRKRQAARSRILALILFGMMAMFFGITLVKIGIWK